ncbi:hypothetical protein THRCLA_20007 [Thraustotheca clavata]|uniref:Uncharacterized protein n=1 Tax=Thraustotheca clavata TaxID=74557 RepID=A0A1W0ACJ1_9STRA|nr:hypothetical protein THRCLA_20007 [Thraustotheca clavata]
MSRITSKQAVPCPPRQAAYKKIFTYLNRLRSILALIIWTFLTINTFLDPAKTFYGYYTYADSDNQPAVWELTVMNKFNNKSANTCSGSGIFLDCYYDVPIYGTGILADSVCRSYYPIDTGPFQHIGTFFANCALPSGDQIYLPNNIYATSQWSLMLSSKEKGCMSALGEGKSFPCDSYTTMNGRVVYYRRSRTVASAWCKEFGGYYILNKLTNEQEVLIANLSNSTKPSLTSIPLVNDCTVYNLFDMLGCSADLTIGGAAGHISTSAWYGETVGLWTAYTTSSPKNNIVSTIGDLVSVETISSHQGNITQIRTNYKDALRCFLFFVVIYYRLTSIYYPIWLVYTRQGKPLWKLVTRRHMGLVLHKRERRNFIVLLFLTIEAVVSTEDIIMYCQQVVFSYPTFFNLLLKYMSITRIIWPSAFILLVISRLIPMAFGSKFAFAFSEDLFLLSAPVLWLYMPAYVTSKGADLFQGWRWTGNIVHHFTNTIYNVHNNQIDVLMLYYSLFGSFTLILCWTNIIIGYLWQTFTHTSSIMSVFLSNNISYRIRTHSAMHNGTIENILLTSNQQFPPEIAYQIVKAKWKSTNLCEAINLASEGFVSLVYGDYLILGITEWGSTSPVFNKSGHAAVIVGYKVAYNPSITIHTLTSISSQPKILGVPDLF